MLGRSIDCLVIRYFCESVCVRACVYLFGGWEGLSWFGCVREVGDGRDIGLVFCYI